MEHIQSGQWSVSDCTCLHSSGFVNDILSVGELADVNDSVKNGSI